LATECKYAYQTDGQSKIVPAIDFAALMEKGGSIVFSREFVMLTGIQ
jgi:hypothetical protein